MSIVPRYGSLRNATVDISRRLLPADVGQVEAEQRDIDRPLVHQPHHHDVAGAAGRIAEAAGLQIAVASIGFAVLMAANEE